MKVLYAYGRVHQNALYRSYPRHFVNFEPQGHLHHATPGNFLRKGLVQSAREMTFSAVALVQGSHFSSLGTPNPSNASPRYGLRIGS
jgi:hypothetical protein